MWISPNQLATATGLNERTVRKVIVRCLAGKLWKGARIEIRQVASERGGLAGQRYEIAVSSLPDDLRLKWARWSASREHPAGAPADRTQLAWSHEERELRHQEFAKLPTSTQLAARKRLEAVVAFHDFEGTDVPVAERLAAAAEKVGKSASAARQWVDRCRGHDRGDWLVLLASNNRGCQVKAPITPEALEWIKDQYLQLTKPALKPIWRRALKLAAERGWIIPSFATVNRLIKALPRWLIVMKREGAEAFDRLYPAQQRDYSSLRLHEFWVSDGRKADVFVRWEDGTVGRPIAVAWQELRSRVLLGYAIGKVESADLIRLSFKNSIERSRAIPDGAVVDNGHGFASKMITGGSPTRYRFRVCDEEVLGILTLLGIKPTWTLPRRARSKPIESMWRTFAEMDKRFPGAYCGNRPGARPDDCDPKKAIPIATYRAAFEAAVHAYNATSHRGDSMHGRTPREVYEKLLNSTQVRQPTAEQIRLCLYAAALVKLDRRDGSANVHGNRYWTEKLADLPTDLNYVVRYDPEDLSKPVAVHRGEQFICEAPLLTRTGFNNQEAAKAHLRAERRLKKNLREQAAAHQDMSRAARWMTPEEPPPSDIPTLPTPKLSRLVHPLIDYRLKPKEKPVVGKEQILEALVNARARRGNG